MVVTVVQGDTSGPAIGIVSAVLKGSVGDPAGVSSLTVDGQAGAVNADGSWQHQLDLTGSGQKNVVITATDALGNQSTRTIQIER